ncbi:mechanosensitive ion channel family protein [Lachnoclostridium sp. An181]|uniref:mechanosensitive ion channel family protein n=1 Tax=Lachnoclostridium sp. An181 TaxID=1965575 RepID=UPI000B370F96|nr:mechanosensitive ion channel domain-containing protein [Lachnoclostridium sp. An181]OUP49921.1 mechanosensitive ion channel protein [Lachnoclostridium sp. An181]
MNQILFFLADLESGDTLKETAEAVEEVTGEVTSQVGQLQKYVNDHIPDLIAFGMKILFSIIFFLIGMKIISILRKMVRKSLERSNADAGVKQFVDSFLKAGLYALLLIMIVTSLGVEPASIAALLASGGVAIGLALQGSLSNFAGGVLILLLKPFVVGDYIIEDTNKNEGTVKEIQIFYTKLATVDNKTIVIPNGTLANTSLTNVTAKDERRLDLTVGISYEADLKAAKETIEKILREDESVLQTEELIVYVDSLADSAVMIGSRCWVKTNEYWPARWRILEKIKLTLDENEIVIPYPQLVVHQK